jgi:hypothetical protein
VCLRFCDIMLCCLCDWFAIEVAKKLVDSSLGSFSGAAGSSALGQCHESRLSLVNTFLGHDIREAMFKTPSMDLKHSLVSCVL